jgi:enoyl-[acyl-carrier protein] reductase I
MIDLPAAWNPDSRLGDMLRGKRGLIAGIANHNSIAFGCARAPRSP